RCAREERQPGGPRRHAVELQAWIPSPVELERDLLVLPLDRFVPPVVEDPDLACAVVPLGDRSFELPVFEWVILRSDGEAFVALHGGQTPRDGPARKGAVVLEADVVVE